jgi:hypothetical protein
VSLVGVLLCLDVAIRVIEMFYVCLVTYCEACAGRERTMIWQQTFKDEYLMSLAHSNGKLDVQQQSTAINGLCV